MPLESLLNPKDLQRSENTRYLVGSYSSRQLQTDKVQAMEIVTTPNNTNMSTSNLTQVNTPMSVGNIQPPGQTSTGSNVFNGFYSSGFNSSMNNLEASLQWLSETRVPNNSLMTDKNLNCNTVPSHSCCVNRLDNLGMCSPIPGETYRSSCRDGNFQTRPSSLSMNVMDSVQSWFNLQPIQSNQQYNGKYPDQNLNCTQMSLPILEQADLKQADINITMPDNYFEPHLSSNKTIGSNLNDISGKLPDVNDVQSSSMKVQNSNFQSSMLPREWKQTSNLQANYVSSPTFFNPISDSPDHFIYSLPPPTSSYCMPISDNMASTSNKQQNCYQQPDKHQNSVAQLNCRPNYIDQTAQLKNLSLPPIQQSTARNEKNFYEKPVTIEGVMNSSDVIQSAASTQKNNELKIDSSRKFPDSLANYTLPYLPDVDPPNETIVHSGISQKLPELTKTIEQNMNDDSSSGTDESNIIVEESDETEEMESVTSIEEMKKTLLSSVELRCLVCNVKSSQKTPATQFIHMNDSFPLTSASRTPVASKLIQIIPADLKHFLKLHNSFMCRRCLNLIETVEVLEVKLTSVKQTLSENFSKTIQCFLPATPIIEIEDGKAEIVDKEIIKTIEKSGLEGALVNFSETTLYIDIQPPKKPCVTVESLVEEVDDVVEDEINDDDDNADTRDDLADEGEAEDDAKVNDGEKRTCDICGKTLSSAKTFKRHMEIHTGAFSFYCETCGKGFNKKSSLETHLLTHSGNNRFQCEKCGQTYSQKHRLETHLRKHAADFTLHCDVCGKGFVQKSLLDKHKLTHTDYRPFVCERCGLTFLKKSGLKSHLDVCEKKDFPCDCCTEVFKSQTNLKQHKMAEHGDDPPASCEICGKVFAHRKDLKPHMRSHSDDKPFRCEICDKSYKTRGDLNYHSKIHNVDKLFKCSVCDKCFSRKQVYDDHMSKHAGNRNYKCTECDKAFFEKCKLQKHLSIHNGGVKRKTCPVCGKEVQHMNVHMRTHSGEKPYECKFCGLAFSINRTLMRHIQSKHFSSV